MKHTNYYTSGKHSINAQNAAKIAAEKAKERKLARISSYNENPKICLTCAAPIPYDRRTNKFCSKTCSASYNNKNRSHTSETKSKISKSLTGKTYKREPKAYSQVHLNTCTICSRQYYAKGKGRKICRKPECLAQISTNKTSKIGSTNSIYYANKIGEQIRFDSSWEYKIACYLDNKNINWIRPKTGISWKDNTGKERFYYPDFYLPDYDLYLDPKNDQVIKKDKEKLSKVTESISLIYGSVKHIKDTLDNRL
jgi:hypothetical protein